MEPPAFSIEYLNELMSRVVQFLEGLSKWDVKDIQKALLGIPNVYKTRVTNWGDTHDLNLIHYCIINNKVDFLKFLLVQTSLYPSQSSPAVCPYAHLAAYLGSASCLKVLLTERPNYFFKGYSPQHAVILPPAILRRFKTPTKTPGVNRKIHSLVSKFHTADVEDYERRSKMSVPSNDHVNVLEKDVSILEKKVLKEPRKFMGMCSISQRQETESSLSPPSIAPDKKSEQKKGKPLPRHRLTVHLDVFGEDKGSPIRGVGEPLYIKKMHSKSGEYQLPIIEDNTCQIDTASLYAQGKPRNNSVTIKESPSTNLKQRAGRFSVSQSRQSEFGDANFKQRPGRFSVSSTRYSEFEDASRVEVGIRKVKTIKTFELKRESTNSPQKTDTKYMNKTPLTIAAERGHIEIVNYILESLFMKKSQISTGQLYIATEARSPESIMVLLEQKIYIPDLSSAVLSAIRHLYPDCLAALLSVNEKDRSEILQGESLYHILYSSSLGEDYRYDMLPEMTRTLIACKEDVNGHRKPKTFPMYTLINCAFNGTIGRKIMFYLECLEILLDAKANPHYNEKKAESDSWGSRKSDLSRQPYSSALNCVLENASDASHRFINMYWLKLLLKKVITTIVLHDKTKRRVLNGVLFDYMEAVPHIGIDRIIVKFLLRYGANPDATCKGEYAINVYFNEMLSYLKRFEMIDSYSQYEHDLERLMIMCNSMSPESLRNAMRIFLDKRLLNTPIQGVPLTRYFCYLTRDLLQEPRKLKNIVSQFLWKSLDRNEQLVNQLPVPHDVCMLILP